MLIIVCNPVSSTNIIQNNNTESKNDISNDIKMKEIRVAIFSTTLNTIYDNLIQYWNGYQWTVGNISYKFIIDVLTNKDILSGKLTTKNYDLLHITYFEANRKARYIPSLRNEILLKKSANFIKDGGGYIGYCAAASIVTGIAGKPKTLVDKLDAYANMGVSRVKRLNEFPDKVTPFFSGIPFLCQISGKPESMGNYAYDYFGGKDPNNWSQLPGIPVDFNINKDNPIFDDLFEEKRRIYWLSGSAYVIPDEQKDNVTVLARYPEEEISNGSTQIHAWKYTGGIHGFISAFLKAKKEGYRSIDAISLSVYKATDWEMTDKLIELNRSNKPMMTMETYPNKNHGRIVLTAAHPEICVWWGGALEEAPDTDNNNLFDGFYTWKNIKPWNETVEDEWTYNWWIVLRQAAWAGKVPDNDLPPVYGPSQISDIYPYEQLSNFTIIGNAETTSIESEWIYHKESLDLYYQYSSDNGTTDHWSEWALYGTDNDISDGWSWEFNALEVNGTGYYQFYSIRHVRYENEWLNETAPPGPDAIAHVNNS